MATISLHGDPIHTQGDLPATGTSLSDIVLTGSNLADFRIADHAGKRIILNIFPSIDTGVCAISVRKFNEDAAKLDNTVVICVSEDLPFAHTRFCGAEGIENLVMASDFRHHAFASNVPVTMTDGPLAGLHSRAIIALDTEGKVIYTEQVPEIAQEPNYEAVAAALS